MFCQNKNLDAVKRLCVAFVLALAAVLSAAFDTVHAAEAYKLSVLSKSDSEGAISGVEWSIYRVAERNGEGGFALCGDFSDCQVSLEQLDGYTAQDAADTLAVFAGTENCEPLDVAVSSQDGMAEFEGLQNGIYLVAGDKLAVGSKLYEPSPALVEIDKGNVEIVGKFTVNEIPDEPEKVVYRVKKIWSNETEGITKRPESIVAKLYNGGELVESVELSEANMWTYEWEALEGGDWKVAEEDVPDGCTVTYKKDGTEFEIINTFDDVSGGSDESSEPDSSVPDSSEPDSSVPDSSEPDLPQTGLLWWPVPVLAAVGLILVAVGVKLGRLGSKKQ